MIKINALLTTCFNETTANECEKILKFYEKVQCGTIHTFQGKEADVVFLVLGSHPEKEGTRKWASSKPNMTQCGSYSCKKTLLRDWKQRIVEPTTLLRCDGKSIRNKVMLK